MSLYCVMLSELSSLQTWHVFADMNLYVLSKTSDLPMLSSLASSLITET